MQIQNTQWGHCAIKDIHLNLILNSNLLKYSSTITSFICPIVLKFCTEHSSITAMLCAKFWNDQTTEKWVVGKWVFSRFEFKVRFSDGYPLLHKAPVSLVEDTYIRAPFQYEYHLSMCKKEEKRKRSHGILYLYNGHSYTSELAIPILVSWHLSIEPVPWWHIRELQQMVVLPLR